MAIGRLEWPPLSIPVMKGTPEALVEDLDHSLLFNVK